MYSVSMALKMNKSRPLLLRLLPSEEDDLKIFVNQELRGEKEREIDNIRQMK